MTLWDIYQQVQIRNVRSSQQLAEREGLLRDQRNERRAYELEDRVEELATLLEALWSLCRDRLSLTDEQLTAAVQETVGREAAERAAGPVPCGSCGAAIGVELEACQFCGADSPRPKSAFD